MRRIIMKQNPLKRVIAWLDLHLEETILIITGSLIGIVIMMQIIMRYVFRHALPWPEEFCRFCYIYFCFISLGYAVRNRCLLNITLHSIAGPSPPRSPYGVGYPHSSIHADRVYHILWGQHRLCESYHHFRPAFPRTADPHDYPLSGHIHWLFPRNHPFCPVLLPVNQASTHRWRH